MMTSSMNQNIKLFVSFTKKCKETVHYFSWLLAPSSLFLISMSEGFIYLKIGVMEKEKTKISNKTATNNYGDTEYWDTRYSKKKD